LDASHAEILNPHLERVHIMSSLSAILEESNPYDIIELDRSERVPGQAPKAPRPEPVVRKYIAVSGTIGAGKSTMVDFLCQRYDLTPFFEPNEQNPYLEDFYKDMKRWSLESQMYFLAAKFKLHMELESKPLSVLQDRTIWEDAEIFAENLFQQGTMSERDYRTYRLLYESMRAQIRPPDLMIYLRCPVRTVRKRIAMRGREMESNIPTAYLKRLHTLYENWIASYTLSPIVIIPTDKLDYMTNLVDRHDIMTTIEKYLDV
jgi:deoxyadenosine/deoxycytidine kinase